MEIDLKLDKVVEAIDLIKRLSWGSIPLWFSLSIPIVYFAYSKLLPDPSQSTPKPKNWWREIVEWFTIIKINKFVIYFSIALFIVGTITITIDQNQKEKIRKNGLRMKQYFVSKSNFNISKDSMITGQAKLSNFNYKDVANVLNQYPSEFIEVENNTIILRDSIFFKSLMATYEILLDSYLSDSAVAKIQDIDQLFQIKPNFFTREVVYKLIRDSTTKYSFCILQNGNPAIKLKK